MRPRTVASVTAAAVATTFDRTQNSPLRFTWNSVLQNFDKTVRNFVHGRFVSGVTNVAKIDMFDKGLYDLQPRKLEKSSAPVNSYSRLSAGLIGHPLPLFLWHMATLSLSHRAR